MSYYKRAIKFVKRIESRENDLYSDAELNVRNWDSYIASKDI